MCLNYFTTMNKRNFAAFILLLGVSTPIMAQNLRQLSLPQALHLASVQNTFLHKVKINQKIKEAEVREKEEQRLPEMDFHASYARINNLTEFKDGFKEKTVTQTIPEWADLTASARLPLYAGSAVKKSIKKAKQENQIGLLQVEKAENDVQIEVTANFLGIFKLMELHKLLKENSIEENDRLREVKQFRKHGTVTNNEVLRAELQLSNTQLKLISNQRKIDVALHDLQTLLRLPEGEPLSLDTSNLLAHSLSVGKYASYMEVALHKEEMRIAAQKEAISFTELSIVKSNYYPKISLFGSYGANYPNYMFFPPNPYVYTLGKIGIEATWSLSNLYKNKSRMHIANQKIEAEKADTQLLEEEISDRVFAQYSQFLEVMDKLPVTEKAQIQAAENYRIVKLKYLNQLALITDMIDADNSLLEAKFNVVSTRIDALMKHYELRYAAGLL